jgi:cytochrome P450
MENPKDDVLSQIIVVGGPEGRALSEVELGAQANRLMVAGHFTSAALCTKLPTMVCLDLRHMARLLEEQTAARADILDHLAKMPLLNSAITETECWLSPVPHLVRRVKEEFEFHGYPMRPGEYAFCSVAGTHMDESLFSGC